jgi:hypothetical protein
VEGCHLEIVKAKGKLIPYLEIEILKFESNLLYRNNLIFDRDRMPCSRGEKIDLHRREARCRSGEKPYDQ